MDLGKNLKAARMTANLTQVQLADKLGVRQKDISRWENGSISPGAESLRELCIALGASSDEILEIRRELENTEN